MARVFAATKRSPPVRAAFSGMSTRYVRRRARLRALLGVAIALAGTPSGAAVAQAVEMDGPLARDSAARSCVVLLHGLGRTAGSMDKLATYLERAGYLSHNPGYPSRSASIAELVQAHVAPAVEHCKAQRAGQVHFVTHSMGGILVRQYLQSADRARIGRVVMLAPPNQGSEIIDNLGGFAPFRWMMGPAALELATGEAGIASRLQPVQVPVGVIAGNRSAEPWFSGMLPGDDDGKVSIQSAQLSEMHDFLVVPAGHTFIMRNAAVMSQVLNFLRTGRFVREEGSDAGR